MRATDEYEEKNRPQGILLSFQHARIDLVQVAKSVACVVEHPFKLAVREPLLGQAVRRPASADKDERAPVRRNVRRGIRRDGVDFGPEVFRLAPAPVAAMAMYRSSRPCPPGLFDAKIM